MTMLLTTTTPFGIVMAADKRLTWSNGRFDDTGRKIVPWPELRAAVGFAGLATLRGEMTDRLIERRKSGRAWSSLEEFAADLGVALHNAIPNNVSGDTRRVYVHVAGFGSPSTVQQAQFHYVRNSEWEVVLNYFQVTEDLRDTFLAKRGIFSPADLANSKVFRVQFSGVRRVFQIRAQRNLNHEARRLGDLRDVANWAAGQIRAVAKDLKRSGCAPVVGSDPAVCEITPEGVRFR